MSNSIIFSYGLFTPVKIYLYLKGQNFSPVKPFAPQKSLPATPSFPSVCKIGIFTLEKFTKFNDSSFSLIFSKFL
jgi:hypothetical protein